MVCLNGNGGMTGKCVPHDKSIKMLPRLILIIIDEFPIWQSDMPPVLTNFFNTYASKHMPPHTKN